MLNKVHPDVVLDDVDEVIDEPNFNNYKTSPDPPSPYADLEKKYRKNRFNKIRNKTTSDIFGVSGAGKHPSPKSTDGNKPQKRKPKKKSFSKVSRPVSGNRNA
ncbi:hypothetical protein G9409_02645 [Chlorobium sp. BLA1]|uniref:hypothetical protein n=1 Tax=Candidatus Chlorobium masyuteum TaxID=2716876 RepID=UPI0014226F7B|nr:hypothetical protein [Candidatus Chlorobium masyuteum]NHQ59500.1 hypothetical protein [Candidatus Chlorobium masyuteum]NTU45202.1 hypothetical protein [Chlorobiaceae bacterium]